MDEVYTKEFLNYLSVCRVIRYIKCGVIYSKDWTHHLKKSPS